MKDRIRQAFDGIRADEGMKNAALRAYRREAARGSAREARSGKARAFRPAAAILCALVLLTGAVGVTAYALPVSYISIDINPSVQLTLNRFDRVVSVTALNREGAALIEGVSLNNLYYTEAVEAVVSGAAARPYLASGGELAFTVASPREEQLIAGIQNSSCGQHGACHSLPAEAVNDAAASGLSLGKYRMYLLIHPLLPSFTPEDCGALSMRRLRELYASLTEGGAGEQGAGSGEHGSGNGGGEGEGHGSGHRHGRQ